MRARVVVRVRESGDGSRVVYGGVVSVGNGGQERERGSGKRKGKRGERQERDGRVGCFNKKYRTERYIYPYIYRPVNLYHLIS